MEKGEEIRTMQAPDRKGTWSRSQQPREKAMVGPRFEQMIMADQVGLDVSAALFSMKVFGSWDGDGRIDLV